MLTIRQYVRPSTLEEAYELCQKKNNVVLGGMLWLKMQNRTVGTAIDLCDLGLNEITESEDAYEIGAMVSLRALETHEGLNALTQGAMAESVKHIVGVQFRNVATVGGSLFGRFGFSDVLTMFLVLDAEVNLYHRGKVSIREFANLPQERDILVSVTVPKKPRKTAYCSMRGAKTDFPTLTAAVSRVGSETLCALGARPGRAMLFEDADGILAGGVTAERAQTFGEYVAAQASFDSNLRGSKEYRQRIAPVLIRRALLSMEEEA